MDHRHKNKSWNCKKSGSYLCFCSSLKLATKQMSTHRWTDKLYVRIDAMQHKWVGKRIELLIYGKTDWILIILMSERSKTKKSSYCITPLYKIPRNHKLPVNDRKQMGAFRGRPEGDGCEAGVLKGTRKCLRWWQVHHLDGGDDCLHRHLYTKWHLITLYTLNLCHLYCTSIMPHTHTHTHTHTLRENCMWM